MRLFLTLLRREWLSFVFSPPIYIVLVFFLLLMGVSFGMLVNVLVEGAASGSVMRMLLGESLFFWLAMLMTVPMITMRLFAEEKRLGTIEALLTAPVGDVTVVMAKYMAAWGFFMAMWLPTGLYAWVLTRISPESAPLEISAMVTSYIGIGGLGAFFIAIGLLASALTSNQAVAAVVTFVALCGFFFWGFTPYLGSGVALQEFGRYTSSLMHMMEFSRGVLDTRPLVFYTTGAGFLLFSTVKAVEARKWRS